MEKRRCVKTDEITVNMLVHALRDVFREEKKRAHPQKRREILSCGWPATRIRNSI